VRLAALVLQVLLVLMPAYGLLESPAAWAQDITGLWRDEMATIDDMTTPKKEVLGQDDFQNHFHGTYRSRPYMLITYQNRQQPEGPYYLYSDVGDLRAELRASTDTTNANNICDRRTGVGDLRAELRASTDTTNAYNICDRRTGKPLGQLHVNSPACAGRQPCFTIESETLDALFFVRRDKLPVLYLQAGKHSPKQDPKLSQTFGDMFTPLTANFDYVLKCWDLSRMSQEDYQYTGCDANVFAIPDAESYSYKKVTLANNHTVAIPFGWTYLSRGFGNEQSRVRMQENGQDVATSDKLKIGVKASLNVMGVTAESHVNVGIQSTVDNMYDNKMSYATGEYLSTQFALVLHKWYAALDREFIKRVLLMRRISEAQRNDEHEYDRFVADFGTHYANAITFGEKGERVVRMSQKQVLAMHQSGTDVSVGLSAGYLGNSVGVDVDKASSNMQKITTNTSTDDRHWFCYSSGPCHDGIPSGGSTLPMLLDLRPITELLAPPFFNDDIILTTIRDGVSRAIAKRAYVERKNLNLPSAVFAQITGFQRYNAAANPASFNPSVNTDGDTRLSPIPTQGGACGGSNPCLSGTVTLQSQDGPAMLLTDTEPPPTSWTIPAQLAPDQSLGEGYDGLVTANFSWSGRCPGMDGATWTFSESLKIRVKTSDFSTDPTSTRPGRRFITSPNCVTADNPSGFIMVAIGRPNITAVVPASTLLGGSN
jgi:hypothetical protein